MHAPTLSHAVPPEVLPKGQCQVGGFERRLGRGF